MDLRSALAKEKAPAKTSLPQSTPTATEALFLFPCISCVRKSLRDRRLRAGQHWKTESRAEVAA